MLLFAQSKGQLYAQGNSEALLHIRSFNPECEWHELGIIFSNKETGERRLVRYREFRIVVQRLLSIPVQHALRIEVGGLFSSDGCTIVVGDYDNNRQLWDSAIRDLRNLGAHVTPPGPTERNITNVQ